MREVIGLAIAATIIVALIWISYWLAMLATAIPGMAWWLDSMSFVFGGAGIALAWLIIDACAEAYL